MCMVRVSFEGGRIFCGIGAIRLWLLAIIVGGSLLFMGGCPAPPPGEPTDTITPTPTPSPTPVPTMVLTVDAGPDRTALVGETVILNGRVSNNVGGAYTFAWTQTAGTPVVLTGADTATVVFVPPAAGAYEFQLTAADGTNTGSDTVAVLVIASNPPVSVPVANAGADRTVPPGVVVELDGRGSVDPAGGALIFQWRQISGPAISLQNAETAAASFTAPQVTADTDLVFELYVKNPQGYDAVATVTITVSPAAVQKNQFNLAINRRGNGSVTPSPGAYDEGTSVTLAAAADMGWIFSHWEGDVNTIANPLVLTMNGNKSITAVFVAAGQVAAPVFSQPANTRFVDVLDLDIACSTPGAAIYYTLDGTEPDTTSRLYTGTIRLRSSVTIKARAFKETMTPSDIASADYYAQQVPGS